MLGLLGVALGIGGIVLMVYHWDLIDTAFVRLLNGVGC